MSTKFNVVEVERSCAEKYRKDLKLTDKITPDMIVKDGRVRLKVFQSVEQYNGIRSAIAWVYKVAWVEMPFAKELATYIIGISRHIAAAKQYLGLKLTKGKAYFLIFSISLQHWQLPEVLRASIEHFAPGPLGPRVSEVHF